MFGGAAIDVSPDEDLPLSARTRSRLGLALFAALSYVPLLLTDSGKLVADTKAYLFLDPGRLLSNATSMWDPAIGLGSVSYQTLGFLFPIGPFYWILEKLLGVPPWIAERLWLGTIICLAGLGTRYVLRVFGVRGAGVPVGMLAYAFSPYAIQFASRSSVLLGPWAALPWMTGFVVLGLRRGGWKYPALLAITVQLAGSVNASTLIFALLAPALWIPYSVIVLREGTWRRAASLVWRAGALVFVTSLWWLIALSIEAGYGLDILRFTETIQTTSQTTFPIEILRGLGYWFFYGNDPTSSWVAAAFDYTAKPGVLLVSLLIPALGLLAAVAVRWRARAYFVLVIIVGVAIAVGTAPYNDPSPIGAAFKRFASGSSFGLALRNSARATPLVVFGLAMLLAAFVSSLHQRLRDRGLKRSSYLLVAAVCALCLANATGVWDRNYYSPYLEWRSVPEYWHQAARALDTKSDDTRVIGLPGAPFSAYRWGDLEDPVEPAIMKRPYFTRDQVPAGSEATANLLQSIDGRLQTGTLDPNAVAPLARLMGVGDVLLDMDLQSDRFGIIPADQLWTLFTKQQPVGLAAPQKFGTKPTGTLIAGPGNVARPALQSPPPLAVLSVEQPLSIVRTKSDTDPLVVDGDAEGLVDVASAGLLDARRLVLYSATYERHPAVLRKLAKKDASLIITDSNRRRPHSTTLVANNGPTEQANEQPLVKNPHDQRLKVFPNATSASQTVTVIHGAKSVQATSGNQPFSPILTLPARTLDGDVKTSWQVDGAVPVGPERLRVQLEKPITTDHVNLVQPLAAAQGRWITRVTLTFDGHHAVHSKLGDSSREEGGRTIRFSRRTFSTFQIRIDHINNQKPKTPTNAVGFAEIRLSDDAPGAQPVRVTQETRMPEDLLGALGGASKNHALTFVISRDLMDDTTMSRVFSLPTARSFTLTGTSALASEADDADVDHALGIAGAASGGVTVNASARFGDALARGSSAIDGDPATAWSTPLGAARGSIKVEVPRPISFDHLDLRLVDDKLHSLPTRIRIESDDGTKRVVELAKLAHTRGPHGTILLPVRFDPIHGRTFNFVITEIHPRHFKSGKVFTSQLLPSGIAELGIPGVTRSPMPAQLPSRCIDDLLTVDGEAFPVRVTGTTADALQSRQLSVQACQAGRTLALAAGTHRIVAHMSPDSASGLDINRLVLSSGTGGDASPPPLALAPLASAQPPNPSPSASPSASPSVRVAHKTSTSMTLQVGAASKPYWLVFGESLNRGWVAKANGHDLGKQSLVDGYANGWRVDPDASGKPTTITLAFTPQRAVRIVLPLSALAYVLCIGIVGVALWRERKRRGVLIAPAVAGPQLRGAFLAEPLEQRRRATIGTVVAMTAIAGIVVTPWVGLLVGALVLLAIRQPRWHRSLRLAPAVIVYAIAVYVPLTQIFKLYPSFILWPSFFDRARIPTWIALMLLGADALIAVVWRTDFDDGSSDSEASSHPDGS